MNTESLWVEILSLDTTMEIVFQENGPYANHGMLYLQKQAETLSTFSMKGSS